MARLEMLPLGDMPEASDGNLVNQDVFRILAHRPEIAKALGDLVNAKYEYNTLGLRLMELLRIRVAFHNQCRSCMAIRFDSGTAAGIDDDVVCSLEKPDEAENLTDAEKAALRYADLFATNHLAIDEAVYDDLRQYFDEGQIVELGIHVGTAVGTGRLAASWHVTEHIPDYLKEDGIVAPWGGEQLRVRETAKTRLLDSDTGSDRVSVDG